MYGTVPGVNHKFSFYNATNTDDNGGERTTKTNNENYGGEGVAWNKMTFDRHHIDPDDT